MDRINIIGGARPGAVEWIDDSAAWVTCYGHSEPEIVYEAACHEGADLSDIQVRTIDASAGRYLVAPGWHYTITDYDDESR